MRRELMQPWGLVHGGVYAAMAESLASWATAMAVASDGDIVMGMSNNTSFLRPIGAGTIHAPRDASPPRPHDLGVGRRHQRR